MCIEKSSLMYTLAYSADELIYTGNRGRDFYAEKIVK